MRGFAIFLLSCLVLTSCNNYGTKLKFKKGELYYTKKVTKQQAEKLGNYLVAQNFFSDDHAITVQLDKSGDTTLFRFVVMNEYLNNEDYARQAATFCNEISKDVFDNKPVVMHFCDDHLKTKKVVYPVVAKIELNRFPASKIFALTQAKLPVAVG